MTISFTVTGLNMPSLCPCVRRPAAEVHCLDYRHSNLEDVPSDVFLYERTLEELLLDANQIRDLPRVSE